ncbi:hypothetical protein [Teredinibacter haidensis]|uniref:aldose epimerase family protein n=1 Tax=Teredinibacter haidensis TaxID=2731755 RepID=UPI000948A7E5|nr:hypothetical protein [Teredinibacter haidensis]
MNEVQQQDIEPFVLSTGDGRCKLSLMPAFGGLINGLWLSPSAGAEPVSVIAGIHTKEALLNNNQYRGVALYPFPNRLDAGQYCWLGETQQFGINEEAFNNTLHGYLYRKPAKVVAVEEGESTSRVELEYDLSDTEAGYPFSVSVRIEYLLSSTDGLTQIFKIVNNHSHAIPVGVGWHPYFELPGCSADELRLSIPAVERAVIDERMLPTGEYTSYNQFQASCAIASTAFDDCFRLADQASQGNVRVSLFSPVDNLRLDVWQRSGPKGYNFIQLYIPPDRKSVAIEPMTCGINAFNTGDGLIELAPGEEFQAHCGVQLSK